MDAEGEVGDWGGPDFISVRSVSDFDGRVLHLALCRGDGDLDDPDAEVECGGNDLGFVSYRLGPKGSRIEAYEGELEDDLKAPRASDVRDALRRVCERAASRLFGLARVVDVRGQPSGPAHRSEYRPPTEKQSEAMLRKAVAEYGLTGSIYDAGYLLPDGSMLDFSEGGGMGRTQDHRNVGQVLLPAVARRYEAVYGGHSKAMAYFMAAGAIRILAQPGRDGDLGVDLVAHPTSEQYREIAQWADVFSSVVVDLSDLDASTLASKTFEPDEVRAGALERWVDRQFGVEDSQEEDAGWLG